MKKAFALVMIFAMLIALSVFSAAEENVALQVGDSFTFGTYDQNGNTSDGKEPIEWTVLAVEGDKALVITKLGLEAISYGPAMDLDAYEDPTLCWETSTLRSWLNDDFLSQAFSQEEQLSILESEIKTSDAHGECTTKDRLFCLSIDEADRYFGSNEAMACGVSESAKKDLKLDAGAVTDGYGIWWLRDMTNVAKKNGWNSTYNDVGNISGMYGTQPAKEGNGMPVFCDYLCTVRPAMWVQVGAVSKTNTDEETSAGQETGYEELGKGSKGAFVTALQNRLNELGYDLGKADGDYGKKTQTAVEKFQKMNNLNVTGIADAATQEALFADSAICAPITRKLNEKFSVNGLDITITSTKFTSQYNLGSVNANPTGIYLCVKLTITNNTGKALSSSVDGGLLMFDTLLDGKEQYGTFFPEKERGYSALMWGLGENTVANGATIDMVYLRDMPTSAKNSGSIELKFEDGTSYVVR